MAYLYILKCADETFYIGSTHDLERRLAQHAAGEGANYTAKRLPVTLAYSEWFPLIGLAFKREKQVQAWSHEKKKALIDGDLAKLKESSKKIRKK